MRRVARAALAAGPAVVAVLLAAAPAAQASHTTPSSHASSSSHVTDDAPPPPPPPALSATPGAPRSLSGCQSLPNQAATSLSGEPWAQQALDFSSVWGISRGQGVTVAVVDSGVDWTPQLNGRLSYKDLTGSGPVDCVGHGTAVASIIAASDERAQGVPFYGVAPAARILSVKVNTGEYGSTTLLSEGIRDAALLGAKVINVSIQTTANSLALRSAVDYALSRNVVVVAAAGNDQPNSVGPFYPASYPGVLAVSAVDSTGAVAGFTASHTPVSVSAPGENVQSDWPGGFSTADQGTSFATAFVSGEAALIRSAFPQLSAAQVVSRIVTTADGNTGALTGAGMIDPVQAVTGVLPPQAATPTPNSRPVAIAPVPRANHVTRMVAVSVTGGALAAAFLVVIGAMVVPHGKRRRWRPGRVDMRAIDGKLAEAGPDWDDAPAGRELPADPAAAKPVPAAPAGPAGPAAQLGPAPTAESGPRSVTQG
jgi:type VII secretion-associated serine protease mycosin